VTTSTDELILPIKIGIIGYGFVGQAVAYGFTKTSNGADTILYYDKYKNSTPLKEVVEQSDYIFIALPTPMKADESGIDLSIITDSLKEITKYTNGTNKIIIIKSTVTPGTTAKYAKKYPKSQFAFNPEFLTEANYLDDFLNAEKTIIGATNDLVSRSLAVIYKQRFPKTTIFQTDPTSAEAVKYFTNNYLAMKVTFANFFYDYCKKIGIKYEEVKNIASLDPRIVNSHLDITTVRGFGQKCFPKDMVALIGEFKKAGVDVSLFETIWEYNKKIRKVHDWQEVPFAVEGNTEKKVTPTHKPDNKKLNKLIYS
jgi:UDPglucose 6-dehydrogenase